MKCSLFSEEQILGIQLGIQRVVKMRFNLILFGCSDIP